MGVNRRQKARTLQRNLRKKKKRTVGKYQQGGAPPKRGLPGLRAASNRTIRTPLGSLNTSATQGQTRKSINKRVRKDNAGRGFFGRTEDQLRDKFGSDDPTSESAFGKYGLRSSYGKRAGSDQGRFGQEFYSPSKQLEKNKDKAKNHSWKKERYYNEKYL